MFDKHLYILVQGGEHGYIKIGSARNIHRRVSQLQTGSPSTLFIYASFNGLGYLESYCHQKLSNERSHGEWFRFTDKAEDLISELISIANKRGKSYIVDSRWSPEKRNK